MELLQHFTALEFLSTLLNKEFSRPSPMRRYTHNAPPLFSSRKGSAYLHQQKSILPILTRGVGSRGGGSNVSKIEELLNQGDEDGEEEEESSGNKGEEGEEEPQVMNADERREWRRKIREVIARTPDVEEETDLLEKRKKMQKLLADYPLLVDEDDPNWPEHDDGWGFNLGQFFNKITVKNVRKDDDENYDSDKEIVWQDDNYIRPIKDITFADWEEAIYKDISPLVVLVHNRYKRPKENEKIRDELEQAVHIIWNCRLPSPRCIAVDANADPDLVSGLQVSVFPELIFIKSGRIIYREKVIRSADELSKIMAFFYYGAAKPPCLSGVDTTEEAIPVIRRQHT